mmetsp:Transcript_6685/g.11375  ORF Transcript_6685/g.11375 Transcript_6685/m.11375 type:complete len:212 (+) Transcript_6685:591-1226(+)
MHTIFFPNLNLGFQCVNLQCVNRNSTCNADCLLVPDVRCLLLSVAFSGFYGGHRLPDHVFPSLPIIHSPDVLCLQDLPVSCTSRHPALPVASQCDAGACVFSLPCVVPPCSVVAVGWRSEQARGTHARITTAATQARLACSACYEQLVAVNVCAVDVGQLRSSCATHLAGYCCWQVGSGHGCCRGSLISCDGHARIKDIQAPLPMVRPLLA